MPPRAPTLDAAGHVVTRDGVALFHRDWGGRDAAPVVLLASWSLASDSWACQMMALRAAGLRCVAYDRRGHGRSADPGRGHDFDTLADDLAARSKRSTSAAPPSSPSPPARARRCAT